MKVEILKEETAEAKVISVYAKPCDSGSYAILDDEGNELVCHDGYVPTFFPGRHYGDYLILEIDLETGQILNWKTPPVKLIEEFIREHR